MSSTLQLYKVQLPSAAGTALVERYYEAPSRHASINMFIRDKDAHGDRQITEENADSIKSEAYDASRVGYNALNSFSALGAFITFSAHKWDHGDEFACQVMCGTVTGEYYSGLTAIGISKICYSNALLFAVYDLDRRATERAKVDQE